MFSVIIPVFNHAQFLHKAIESALKSALVSEILLADDGSKDRSASIIADFARQFPKRVFDLTGDTATNCGAHVRLNQLSDYASQEWIAVLNSDDEFVPGRFEVAQIIARTTDVDLVGGALLIIDENDRVIGEKRGLSDPEYPFPLDIEPNYLTDRDKMVAALCNQNFFATTSNMIYKKSLFKQVGGFKDLRYSHDWEFALSAALTGNVHLSRSYFSRYRIHSSNTIKEASGHVDGEITRFFSNILTRFPEIEELPTCRAALQANRHLSKYVPLKSMNLPSLEEKSCATFGWSRSLDYYEVDEDVNRTSRSFREESRHYYLRSSNSLPSRALENAAIAVQWGEYDFVVISSSLEALPLVTVDKDGRVEGVYNSHAAPLFFESGAIDRPLRGRLIRCAAMTEPLEGVVSLLDVPGFQGATFVGSDILLNLSHASPASGPVGFPLGSEKVKPLVLVLPMFLAVGGVERNTIEIIRALQAEYQFLVVTTEWQSKHQGSLHYQLDKLRVPVLDLAEICDRSQHVNMLAIIEQIYKPDAVWICNGSPWLADQAENVRRVFSQIPIIDQQVYDTQHGWINRYNDPGIQSFDHFIAVNARIKEKFLHDIRIPSHRVSLIYSAIDDSKLGRPVANSDQIRLLKQEIGLESTTRCFAFIGRLTAQKRPLLFLELVRLSALAGFDDVFLLVGDGELGEQCDSYIVEHALKNVQRIKYYDDTWSMMGKIDGLIITSAFEGLPIVLLEALSFGRPAFSTDVGDIRLVLEAYDSGSVFDVDASKMWEHYCDWLDRLDVLSRNALHHRSNVLQRFSSSTISRQYSEIWSSAINAKSRDVPSVI